MKIKTNMKGALRNPKEGTELIFEWGVTVRMKFRHFVLVMILLVSSASVGRTLEGAKIYEMVLGLINLTTTQQQLEKSTIEIDSSQLPES